MPAFMRVNKNGPSLKIVASKLGPGLQRATVATGQDLKATWRRRVHKITHRTELSIEFTSTSPYSGKVTGSFGAWWEEYGNRFRPPHPSAGPSVEEVRPRAVERARQAVEEAKR